LNKIRTGEVKMRSKLNVLAEKIGIRSGVILLFLGLIILSGLISYWFKLNSDLIFGGYARFGLRIFTQTLPYTLVITFILLFLLLSIVLRKFDISYKKPFIAVLSLIMGLVLILGWFSLNNQYGKRFYQYEGRYFGMGRMMNGANIANGQVMQVDGNTLILNTQDGKTVMVTTSNNTHYPFGTPKAQDIIRSVGVWNGDYFEAVGIRVFDEDDVNGMIGRNGMGKIMNGQGRGRWSR
ncbi:hypothetical protein WDW89_25225, partial [Deltaproteobacteria bacterium TL4]